MRVNYGTRCPTSVQVGSKNINIYFETSLKTSTDETLKFGIFSLFPHRVFTGHNSVINPTNDGSVI